MLIGVRCSTMTITSPAPASDYLSVLEAAVAAFPKKGSSAKRPAASAVVAALLAAEKAAKQSRSTIPFEALTGRWRLWFFTGTRKVKQGGITIGRGFYAPPFAPAQISFSQESGQSATPEDSSLGTIGNQVQLGALKLRFTGPARYPGKKNLLAFDFTQLQLWVGERKLTSRAIRSSKGEPVEFGQQSIAQLPFFAFFLATENYIAARGRGGGLAIWVREPDRQR